MKSIFNILKQKNVQSPIMRGAMASLTVEESDKILNELFGEKIQNYAQTAYIKNKILAIRFLGSAAAQEIKLNEAEIMTKINQKFGPNTVVKIKYTA